ncbi:MAG: pyridoxamine 5'-phosphate oxidase family protein [Rhizomicrobium sp.]
MAKFYDTLSDELNDFIMAQPLFFVATAPRKGRVNVSPKGMDTFRILGDRRVAYLDLTGSGNETAAHLRDNGRITVMFCSFRQQARVLRIYGRGRAVRPSDPEWEALRSGFGDEPRPAERQIMDIAVERVMTSCGYAVPRFDSVEPRVTFTRYWENHGPEAVEEMWRTLNDKSIDGLPTGIVEHEGDAIQRTEDAVNAAGSESGKKHV